MISPPLWNWQSSEWTLCFSMQSMRAHLKQSTNRKIYRNVTRWILHLKLGELRVNSFTFQCSQWELIWNSHLIGRYKEMLPGESNDTFHLKQSTIGRYKEMSPGESYDITPPSLKLAQLRVNSSIFHAVNESSFETVN